MAEPNINTAAAVGSITTAAATTTTLDLLQAFHRHVLALADGRAESLDALAPDRVSDTFVAELAKIWQPAPKNEREREMVRSATIPIDGTQYSISDEFRDVILALSDEVEVAEFEAARCALDAQQDLIPLGRPLLQCAVIRYHQQRKYVLDALRVLMDLDNQAEEDRSDLLDAVKQFVQQRIFPAPPPSGGNPTLAPPRRSESSTGTGPGRPAPDLCMTAIGYVRALLRKVGDKLLAASMLGQDRLAELEAEMHTLEYTRAVLYQQHEIIGIILSRCIARRQPQLPDFTPVLDMLRRADRYDALLVHLIPALAAHISLRAFEGDWSRFQAAREMHAVICAGPPDEDALTWPLPYLQATVKAWWLAEYSGFFVEEPPEGRIPPSVNMDQEDKQKTKSFSDALKEGAFDFFLAVAADVKAQEWQDPARAGMRQWLQRKTPALAPEWTRFQPFFKICLMQHLETFVEAAISNLPDVLRRLRVEEDEQRQLSQTHEHDLDLERFLIVIAYTYEDRPDAAMAFWSDPDANLAGFMHWASRRASTPLVSAFCEMLGAISETAQCAEAAHEFLLDEGRHASGKMRRTQSLTWTQILRELEFFSDKIRERPAAAASAGSVPSTTSRLAAADQAEAEPESAMMLECYLRLMTRLASGSESAREFLLQDGTQNVADLLFQLAGSPVPARLRACVFTTLQALLTCKSYDDGHMMWGCLDGWMTGAYAASAHSSHPYHHNANHHYFPHHNWAAAAQPPSPSATMERIFDDLGAGFEEPLAFVQLLTALVVPSEDDNPLNDALQFPENLGAAVRAPGIDMYVDFVLGRVFASPDQPEDQNQTRMLRLACLQFALACLNTFNENLIVLANGTNIDVDNCIVTTDLATYVRLHPFGRVMEWMLTDQVMTALFGTIHQQDTAEAGSSAPESPLIQAVLCAVEVISKVLELQPTYLDLVRPMIARPPPPPQQHRQQQQQQPSQQQAHMQQQQQQQRSQRRGLAAAASAAAASASLEDGLITHLGLVVDLGVYCGMGHADLTLACLRLLKTMSESLRISSGWSTSTTITAGPGGGDGGGRNKAIVAMEADGEHEQIAQALIMELRAPLPQGSLDSAGYQIKIHILDFLLACLRQSPRRPTIAHLLLGFRCGVDSLSADPRGAFDSQTSLFHALLQFLVETPVRDGGGGGADDQSSSPSAGIRQWTAALRARTVAVLRILWTSPLSAPLVVPELRLNEFLFHLLLGETVIRPNLAWEGTSVEHPFFCTSDGAGALADFLSARAASLDYMAMELCSVAQGGGLPALKRRVLEALVNGQLRGEDGGGGGGDRIAVSVPTVFDLFDFQLPPDAWDLPPPPVDFYRGLDLECCREDEEDDELGAGEGGSGDRPAGPVRCRYNLNRVREILLLRLAEYRAASESNQLVIADQELVMIEREDDMITAFLRGANRRAQIVAEGLRVLRSWTRLLLVMVECNDFGGTARTSFFLQALQAILPSLELCASDRPAEAVEIAAVARILLFKLDLTSSSFPSDVPSDPALGDVIKGGRTRRSGISSSSSNLVSERLYQLFQICVAALARRAGDPRLRAVYYSICYRYVAGAAAASAAVAAAAAATAGAAPPATAAPTDEPDAPLVAAAAATRHRAANVVHLYGDKLLNVICDDACGGDVACQTAALVLLAGLVGMAIREGDFWVIEIMNRLNFVGVLVDSLRNVLEEWMLAVEAGSEEVQNYHNAKLALLLRLAQTRDGAQHIINANLFRSLQLSGLFAADPELQANPENPHTLERLYHLLASVARIISAAIVSRGSHNIIQGQRFLRENRSLVSHTLKRSAGVGPATASPLEVKLWDLTEALIVLITATDFLESEEKELAEIKQKSIPFFH